MKKRIWVRVLSWMLVIVMLMGNVMPAYAAETEGITTEVEGASTETEEGTGEEDENSVEETVTDTEERATEIDDTSTGAENETTDTAGEQSGEAEGEDQTGETGDNTSSDSSEEQMGENESEGSGKEDDTTSMPSDETEVDSAPSDGTRGESSEEDGVVANDSNSEEGVSDEKTDDTLLTDNLIVSATDDGIATIDVVDGSNGSDGSSSNPYILWMKDGKCTNNELRSYIVTKTYDNINKFVFDEENYNKYRVYIDDTKLEKSENQYGLLDNKNYEVKQTKEYRVIWNHKETLGTKYLLPKYYYSLFPSISGAESITVNDISITTITGKTYTLANDILPTNNTIDILKEDFPITIKVAPVERMKQSISFGGVDLTVNQNTGEANVNWSNTTTSGNLIITYQPVTYHKVTPSSNVEGVTYKFLNMDAEEGELDYSTDMSGNKLSYFEVETATNVSIEAVAPAGYSFVRWWKIERDGSKKISYDANPIETPISSDITFEAVFAPSDSIYVVKNVTKDMSYSEYELPLAFSSAASGDKIVLQANATLSESVSIPEGVDFLIPYAADKLTISDNTDTLHANSEPYVETTGPKTGGMAVHTNTEERYLELDVNDNISITVKKDARFVIGGKITGQLAAGKDPFSGCTTQAFSNVELVGTNSKIVVEAGGILSSCGFIYGSGKVVAEAAEEETAGGAIYQPFSVGEYHNGSYTGAIYGVRKTSPFNCYAALNIRTDIDLNAGSSFWGYLCLYAGEANNQTTVKLIGTSDALIQTASSTRIEIKYDSEKHPVYVDSSGAYHKNRNYAGHAELLIYGDTTIKSMTIKIKNIVPIDVNTSEVVFPVPYNLSLNQINGTLSVKTKYKIMPGAVVKISKDATLQLESGAGVTVYDGFVPTLYSNHSDYPYGSVLTNGGYSEVGHLYVDGTLKVMAGSTLLGKIEASPETSECDGIIIVEADSSNKTVLSNSEVNEGVIQGETYMFVAEAKVTTRTTRSLTAQVWNPHGGNDGSGAWENLESGKTYYMISAESSEPEKSYTFTKYTGTDGSITTTVDYVEPVSWSGHWVCPEITFDCNCTTPHTSITAAPGADITAPTCVSRTGYTFAGWYTEQGGKGTKYFEANTSTMPKDEIALYAHWVENTYTLAFDGGSGAYGETATGSVESISGIKYADVVTLPEATALSIPGHTFTGWKIDDKPYQPGEKVSGLSNTAGDTVTAIAQWEPNSHTIEFDLCGGKTDAGATTIAALSTVYGADLSDYAYSLSKSGYTFGGWYTGQNGSGTRYLNDGVDTTVKVLSMPDSDLILYAHWLANPYYVNVSVGEGKISDTNWLEIEEGIYQYTFTMNSSEFTLPAPEKTGYTFTGWTGESVNTAEKEVSITPADAIASLSAGDDTLEYVANYEARKYTIQYDGNGGNLIPGLTDKQTAVYDQDIQLTYAIYTRDGYTFAGWSTDKDATEAKYLPSKILSENLSTGEDITLYAIWSINSYNATFYLDENEEVFNQVKYNYAEEITPLEADSRDGYRFDYWYYLNDNGDKVEFFTDESGNRMPLNGIELYAHWTKEQYTVKFMDGADELSSHEVTFGEEFNAPANPTKEGYQFTKWDGEIPTTIPDLGEYGTVKKVNAEWNIEQYTLKFVDTDGTTEICNPITQEYGSAITTPTVPEKSGYTFKGWNENVPTVMPDYGNNGAEKIFIAQWETEKYDVTVHVGNGTINETNWTTGSGAGEFCGPQYTIEDKYLLPKPARTGYEFTGWDVTDGTVTLTEENGNYYIPVGTTGNVELTAKWTPKTITVELNAGKGILENHTGEVSVTFDTAYGLLPTPILKGYDFLGWYDCEQTEEASDDSHKVTKETVKKDEKAVLYAHWAIDSFTIIFDTNGGSEIAAVTEEYGTELQISDPTRVGYVFAGWYQTESEDGALSDSYTITTMPAENMTLYAGWTPIVYTLELDANNGSLGEYKAITYTVEDTVESVAAKLPTPERTGYSFAKWNRIPSTEFMPANTVKLTAEWSINTYDLKFFIEGNHRMTLKVEYGTLLDNTYGGTIIVPSKTGYTFDGWYTTESSADGVQCLVEGCKVTMNEGMSLYARYKANTYTIKFDSNKGTSGTVENVSAIYDAAVTWPENAFVRKGYTFVNWNTKVDGSGTAYDAGSITEKANLAAGTAEDAEVTVYAIWSPITYTVGFDGNGAESGSTESITVNYDEYVEFPECGFKKTGYTFKNWLYLEDKTATPGSKQSNLTSVNGAVVTVKALWKPIEYTVEFDLADGEGSIDACSVKYDAAWNAPSEVPTKSGYDFAGWKILGDTSEMIYSAEDSMPTKLSADPEVKVKLIAQWTPQQYDITLHVNDDVQTTENIKVIFGQSYAYGTNGSNGLSTLTRAGYKFNGWYVDETFTSEVMLEDIVKADHPTRLYAKWTAEAYRITYLNSDGWNMNGLPGGYSTGAVPEITVKPEKTGYTFTGWKKDGETGEYIGENLVIAEDSIGDLVFWLTYKTHEYTVSFDANGGEGTMEVQKFTYDQEETALTATKFTKNGYLFEGWSRTANAKIAEFTDEQPVQNLTSTDGAEVQLYAVWTPITYTVVFDGDGADSGSVEEIQAIYDTEFELPECGFEKNGYTFKNWSYVEDTDNFYNPGDKLINLSFENQTTVTIKAVWEKNVYTITLNPDGGEFAGIEWETELKYSVDSETIVLPILTKTGYTFQGWGDGSNYVESISTGSTGNLNLTADWVANSYTVSFNSNGGNGIIVDQQFSYDQEKTALTKNTFTKKGYTFTGWARTAEAETAEFADEELVQNLVSEANGNIQLYAVWRANTYTVVFDGDGADSGSVKPIQVIYDQGFELPECGFAKTGYTFTNWLYSGIATIVCNPGDTLVNLTSKDMATVTIQAVWEKDVYSITLDSAGGNIENPELKYSVDSETIILPEITKTGYTFKGWSDGNSYVESIPKGSTGNVELTAEWAANKYKVAFDANGGDGSMEMMELTYDQEPIALTTNSFTRTGYTFAGWMKGDTVQTIADDEPQTSIFTDGQEVSNLTANDGEVITLYAVWTPNKYRIHFDGNGHTEGTVASVEAVYDAAVTWPENGYNKVGYLFVGWNTKADGSGTIFKAGKATSAANLATGTETDAEATLYAMWNPIAYSIKFNGNGENSGSMPDVSLKYDEQISLIANDFVKNGYHFAGWATEADGEVVYEDAQKVSNLTTENNQKVTLYAVWTANTYTIEFDGNGATGGTTVSKSFTYDTQDTLTFNGYERTGYTFIGWSLSASSTTASYTDGQEVGNLTSADANKVTLYAIWTANTYTVNFDGNGATSGETASKTFTYDRNAPLSANGFVRTGYTFGGWTLDKDGAGTVYADKQSVKNLATGLEQNKEIVLYAVWNANTYTVVFGKNHGTGSMESQQLTYDQETTLNVNTSITRSGYTFLGWDTDLNAVTPTYPQTKDVAGNVVGAAVKNLTPIPNGSVYLYAIWQANTYTAEFMLNSPVETTEAVFAQTEVVFDSKLVLPEGTPEIEGYRFSGWYTAPTGGTRVTGFTKLTTETPVYYAQWTIKTNTITLMLEDCEMTGDANWSVVTKDGKKQAAYKADYATAVPIPPASVKTGYSFVKWQNESGEEFIFDDNTKMPSDNRTLYPVWQINQYTITFKETGDTVIAPITQDYETPVEAPEDPVKEGHTFKGWDTKIPDTMPAENVTIKAIWTINSYDVIYENTGETTIPSIEVVYAEEVLQPTVTPVYKGYEFKHWSLTANGDEVEFPVKMPAEDLKIYAVYDSYLDWILATDITVEEEFLLARGYFQKLNDTQIAEYKQTDHWNEFSAKIKEISTISLRQSVIDAQTVTNDILSKVAFTEEIEGEQTTKIIDLAEMKVFDEELKANPPKIEGMIKEDQYAAINMLNVEFMTALFDHDEIVSIVADNDTEPDESLKEHVLTGNTIASSGTLASDQFNIMLIIAWAALDPDSSQQDFMNYLQSQMTTLKLEALDGKSLYITAKAESPEGVPYEAAYALEFYSETHDLIYDFDGGNATEYQKTAKYEETVTLVTPVKRGHTFEGWTSEAVSLTDNSFIMGRTDVSLKANWSLDAYQITLDLGNGTLIDALQSNWPDNAKNYDALTGSIVLPDENQMVAPSGYAFGGWYVDDDKDTQMNVVLNPSDDAFELKNITYRAKWIPIEYTLKFVMADKVDTVKFTVETTNIEIPVPERYGYTFEGWDGELTYPMPANDVTLTAQWKAKEIPVTLYLNDGTEASTTVKAIFDGNFGILPTPEREGYGFDGWFTEVSGGKKYDGTVNVTSEAPVELYAHWTAGSYTINYTGMEDAVNHADNPSSYVVDTEVELKAPTKTGYTFLGWSGNCVEEKSGKYYIVAGTIGTQTVTANWQINQYKITFDSNGGNEIEAIEADYLEMVIAPDEPSREGYTFAGWFAGDIQYFENSTSVKMPLNGLNLKAKWNINSHSITFLKADGSIHDVKTYNYSQTMEPKTADEIEGYTFVGWFDADGIRYFATETGEEKAEKMPDKELSVIAKYRINQYTFSFNTECETIIDAITRDYASVINAPDEPVKTGHTFLGWFDSEGREYFEKNTEGIAKVETVPAKDVELTAKWEVNKYSFVFMDGELEHAEITADYGTAVSEPAEPTKTGYIFVGWDQEVPTSMPAEDKVFNAQWNAIRYAVTFNSNGAGNIALPENMTELAYDTSYAIPELIPERTGYTFKGWKTDALAEETIDEIYNLTVNNEQTVTLYASWEAKTYTVTFDANGGTVEPSSKEVTYDDVYGELPLPEWEGYAFSGWTDGTTIYTESTVVKITEDQTLTAQWTEKGDTPYKVVHHLQNLADDEYTKDEEIDYTGKTNGTANAAGKNYTGFVLNTEKSAMSGIITGDGALVLNLYYDRIKYKVTWNTANTSVEEFYKYEAMPEYKGEKDFTDDHGIHTFTAWDKKIEKAETDVVYTALYDVDYEASIGEITYITLEKAISKAKSGETVRLDKDITLSENLTIPAGVNLLLPCIDDDYGYNLVDKGKLKFNHDGTSTAGGTGVGPYAKLYRTLTIPEGVTLNVKGNVLVNSVSGRPVGGTADMDITGGYAVIELDGNIIVKKGGNLDCFGYIRGDGKVTAENGGSVGDLFIVRHWRGGTQAFAMYQSIMNYGTKEAPINRQVYPMNEYDCHNIETDVIVEYGASYDGLVKMCANAGDGNAYYYTRFPQVNVSNGMIRLVSEDGYVVRTYDKEDGKDIYTIYGGAKFAESSLNIAGVSLTTKDFLYPMDGDYCFELYDGNYSFINDFKFLPGGSMVVHSGSTLKIEDDVFVAFYDEFNDKPNTGNTQYPVRDKMVLKIEEDAKFINAGTFGGSIVTESADILIGDYPKWTITTMEANGYCGSPATVNIFHDLFITREGYDWRYGDPALGEEKDSIIWIGADYTALDAALSTIPDDLKIYSDETVEPLKIVTGQIVYGLGKDKQSLVDDWTKAILNGVENLKLRVVKVVFNANGGTCKQDSMNVTYGDAYGKLPEAEYYGYIFLGWFDADNMLVTAEHVMKKTVNQITLTAKWEEIPADYSKVNEAIAAIPQDMTGYTEESVKAVYDAQNAVDMTLGLAQQEKVDAMADAILDAIERLERVQIVVSFDANGGDAVEETFTLRYGDIYPYNELPTPSREGFEFVAWYTAKEGGSEIKANTKVTSVTDVVLYAKWLDSSSNEPADYSPIEAAKQKIPADLRPYTAASVNKLNEALDAVVPNLMANRQDDINAWAAAIEKAVEELTFKTITVYFDPVGGVCTVKSIQVTYGTECEILPAASKEYSKFLGWYTAKEGGVKVEASELASKLENVTLYAQYELLPADYSRIEEISAKIPADLRCYSDESVAALNTALSQIERGYTADKQSVVDRWANELEAACDGLSYRMMTMTYDAQGGKVSPKSTVVQYNSTIKGLPTPELAYNVFDGWFTEAEGGEKVTEGMVITNLNDFSIYAHWIQIDADYTKVYEALAKVPAEEEWIYYTDESIAELKAAIDAVQYGLNAGHQSQVNNWAGDINFARQKLRTKSVIVTFEYNGGTGNPKRRTIPYGNAYGTLPQPTKEGYRFVGWYTENVGGEKIESTTKVLTIEKHTLYARWDDGKADYTAVEEAIAKIPHDISSGIYTEESVKAVEDAVAAVVYNLPDTEQKQVDAWAAVINEAVAGLKEIECDEDTVGPNCPSKHYIDIDATEWYHVYVDFVVKNGLMIGTDTDTFEPESKVTRAMFVTILYSMSGETVSESIVESMPFLDVNIDQYYAKAVAWAVENKIVAGFTETFFAPDQSITREQIAVILRQYAKYKECNIDNQKALDEYADADTVSDWAVKAMEWAIASKMFLGYEEVDGSKNIRPQGEATRAEVAAIIRSYCKQFN